MTQRGAHPLGPLWPGPFEVIADRPERARLPLAAVLNRAILGDAATVLQKFDPEIVDCVFFDPPYFLQLSGRSLKRWGTRTAVDGVDSAWDQFDSFAEYDALVERVARELKRVMKPTATLWAIGTYHNIFRIGTALQDLGFWLLNDVTWLKTNPMPNWLGVRFTNATETLIWAKKSKDARGYTFRRDAATRFGVGKVGAGVWVLPLCAGKERLKGPGGKTAHPTQKPVELLRRVLLTSTMPGDLVLDPMAGVGTSGYVCRALDRDYIMIERDRGYVAAMGARFEDASTVPPERLMDSARVSQYLKASLAGPEPDTRSA